MEGSCPSEDGTSRTCTPVRDDEDSIQ